MGRGPGSLHPGSAGGKLNPNGTRAQASPQTPLGLCACRQRSSIFRGAPSAGCLAGATRTPVTVSQLPGPSVPEGWGRHPSPREAPSLPGQVAVPVLGVLVPFPVFFWGRTAKARPSCSPSSGPKSAIPEASGDFCPLTAPRPICSFAAAHSSYLGSCLQVTVSLTPLTSPVLLIHLSDLAVCPASFS